MEQLHQRGWQGSLWGCSLPTSRRLTVTGMRQTLVPASRRTRKRIWESYTADPAGNHSQTQRPSRSFVELPWTRWSWPSALPSFMGWLCGKGESRWCCLPLTLVRPLTLSSIVSIQRDGEIWAGLTYRWKIAERDQRYLLLCLMGRRSTGWAKLVSRVIWQKEERHQTWDTIQEIQKWVRKILFTVRYQTEGQRPGEALGSHPLFLCSLLQLMLLWKSSLPAWVAALIHCKEYWAFTSLQIFSGVKKHKRVQYNFKNYFKRTDKDAVCAVRLQTSLRSWKEPCE